MNFTKDELEIINELLRDFDDCGPRGEGWQSKILSELSAKFNDFVESVEKGSDAISCLKQIANPMQSIEKEAKAKCCLIDGRMAFSMTNDIGYIKSIAIEWLKKNLIEDI